MKYYFQAFGYKPFRDEYNKLLKPIYALWITAMIVAVISAFPAVAYPNIWFGYSLVLIALSVVNLALYYNKMDKLFWKHFEVRKVTK